MVAEVTVALLPVAPTFVPAMLPIEPVSAVALEHRSLAGVAFAVTLSVKVPEPVPKPCTMTKYSWPATAAQATFDLKPEFTSSFMVTQVSAEHEPV